MPTQAAQLSVAPHSHPAKETPFAGQPSHAEHHHAPASPGRAVHIGPSILRLSAAARLVIAAVLLLPLWIAVFLVMG